MPLAIFYLNDRIHAVRYKVTLDAYPVGGPRLAELRLPAIPGTRHELEFDTDSGIGKKILDGYDEMRSQVGTSRDSSGIAHVRGAVNAFL